MGPPPTVASATKSLLSLNESLRAIERDIGLEEFYGMGATGSELTAKPLVLVIGQYSTGKTTFISTLCGHEYDGAHIGPEPTTEKFVAVVGVPGDKPRSSKRGNFVSMMPGLPFGGLAQYCRRADIPRTGHPAHQVAAAAPRPRRGDSVETSRGEAVVRPGAFYVLQDATAPTSLHRTDAANMIEDGLFEFRRSLGRRAAP